MPRPDFRRLLSDVREQKRKVLVVGLGISGVEAAKFLARAGIAVVAVEREQESQYLKRSKYVREVESLRGLGVSIHFGIDGEKVGDLLDGVVLCVLSPGVSLESAVCGALRSRGVPLVSELELGVELLGWPSIVVTGSNGKSTTVTLIDHILRESGYSSILCGNVGIPVIAQVSPERIFDLSPRKAGEKEPVLVVEASSYQLESCGMLRPRVAILLNISDNHLERHGTLARYFEIKSRLFSNQERGDFAVLNLDDSLVATLAPRVNAGLALFGSADSLSRSNRAGASSAEIRYDASRSEDAIGVVVEGRPEEYRLADCFLLGEHNRYNMAAAILAVRSMGVDFGSVQRALLSFKPLEHRLELFARDGKVTFINDSKSTTVAATVAAFSAVRESFPQQGISLMIGGLAKAGSWQPLMNSLSRHKDSLRSVTCFGKDANILAHHCKAQGLIYQTAATLKEGVGIAYDRACPSDVLLLSPGCASFDEFTDFEDRGNVFKSLVREQYVP